MSSTVHHRKAQGEQTRRAILQCAMDLASVDGLTGLSIGGLAKELQMSKSGLFAHFGSKEALQLAVIEGARHLVLREVVRPALRAPKGLPRLWSLCEAWLHYTEQQLFRGGCFFAATSTEFNSRPGPIRDRLADIMAERQQTFARLVARAQEVGDIHSSVDPVQLAYELDMLLFGANWAFQLYGDGDVIVRSQTAMRHRLKSVCTHPEDFAF
ncbi:TetR/AcrR family transcriptional regulator [Acaryochloris marina]|uniref:Transcriptional regulator, TetR family n=1 Tax=Acaryochloris marina (strain MBIC 11017) TaxID=329726 RepID=B0CBP7_ACAM1|nr:TetR/AcrR family transcriptional regulator [Acaryochloris marina]ABW29165.1 transcriptional regulator, TetR family [Acaryochloris marina MBIC11017]BDM78109.1 TetR family transcriptional regulator [Acaryochloris marina MBIC10699]